MKRVWMQVLAVALLAGCSTPSQPERVVTSTGTWEYVPGTVVWYWWDARIEGPPSADSVLPLYGWLVLRDTQEYVAFRELCEVARNESPYWWGTVPPDTMPNFSQYALVVVRTDYGLGVPGDNFDARPDSLKRYSWFRNDSLKAYRFVCEPYRGPFLPLPLSYITMIQVPKLLPGYTVEAVIRKWWE
jgi:hypothetical protein